MEFFTHAGQPDCLAISFWRDHAEIPLHVLFHAAALLLCQNRDIVRINPSDASNQCPIIPRQPISVQFHELIADLFYIICRVGTFLIPCQLHLLPCVYTVFHYALLINICSVFRYCPRFTIRSTKPCSRRNSEV